MAVEVRMAKLSPTMETGTINRWVKKEGDKVASGDTLAEVETDKASMPLETFEDGVLLKIVKPEGSTCAIDELVGVIGKAGEDISSILSGAGSAAPAKAAPAAAAPAKAPAAKAAGSTTAPAPVTAVAVAPAPVNGGRVKASPLAKKIAKERGIDLHALAASGPGGRIVVRDLDKAPALTPPAGMAAPVPVTSAGTDIPLTNIRQVIAKRLLQSKQTIPHWYCYMEVNMERALAFREDLNTALPEGATKISVNDIIVKVCATALQRHPEVNASFNQTSIRRYGEINIAVAVATDDGLYTPVLRNVDRLGFSAISSGVRELAKKARDKKLSASELTGSGFTISNLGMFGVDSFVAIINPPEAAILAVGAAK
ncbi:MAG TPA: dihydrolipoamide acetyltransferase family protein, partial [Planctomycetota bacterium]|nr:dihydrolipoamide acetyltransferase family protein [Planctomycetota bacterium]